MIRFEIHWRLMPALVVAAFCMTTVQAQSPDQPDPLDQPDQVERTVRPDVTLIGDVAAPTLAGSWHGEKWGDVDLMKTPDVETETYTGRYTDTFSQQPGRIDLRWSKESGRFEGTWSEGEDRGGKLAIRVLANGKAIRGSWTTDANSKIQPGKPEHSDLEWTRVGAQAKPEQLPPVSAKPAAQSEIKIFSLTNANAVECAELLKPLFPNIKFSADSRTNSIIIVTAVPENAMEVEAILLKLDETKSVNPRDSTFSGTPATVSFVDSPKVGTETAIAEHEALAKQLADQIRGLSPKQNKNHPDLVNLRKKLEATLKTALDLKFQHEQAQLSQLQKRTAALENQLRVRRAISNRIVERRMRDLLEPAPTEWSPSDKPIRSSTADKSEASEPKSKVTPQGTTQVRFHGPVGMWIQIESDPEMKQIPCRHDFSRDSNKTQVYSVTMIPNDKTSNVSTILEIYPLSEWALGYVKHNQVPLQLTTEDQQQIQSGNGLVKVVYLPFAKHQELAPASTETIASSHLDPGADPVIESRRRGSILAVWRISARTTEGDTSVGNAKPSARKGSPEDDTATLTESSRPGFPISSFSDLASKLAEAESAVHAAQEKLNYTKALVAQKVVSTQEMQSHQRELDDAIRLRRVLQEDYRATLKDLELQIESAEGDVNDFQHRVDRLEKLEQGSVPTATIREASEKLRRAIVTLKRLKVRYDFFKSAQGIAAPSEKPEEKPTPADQPDKGVRR